jgi:hypothetical protein
MLALLFDEDESDKLRGLSVFPITLSANPDCDEASFRLLH